jgi:hypothetical protein
VRSARSRLPASGIWSTALYFQLVRGQTGDELRVSAADSIYRWRLPWGLPATIGETGLAVEEMMRMGYMVALRGIADEGFCYVDPFERGALGYFLLGHNEGSLRLSLSGTSGLRAIELRRNGVEARPGAWWTVIGVAATRKVA